MKHFIYVSIALSLLSSGCVEVSESEQKKSAVMSGDQAGPTHVEKIKDQVKAQSPKALFKIENNESPNSYKVILLVPEDANTFVKSGEGLGNPQKVFLGSDIKVFVDQEAKPGQKYTYQFGKLDPASAELSHLDRVEVKVPIDLVISSDVDLKEKTDWTYFQRIFLLNRCVITTHGNELNVNAVEIISEDAKFQSFQQNQKALLDTNGRSGGQITLIAEKAIGKMIFELRGESGGDGGQEKGLIPPAPDAIITIYRPYNIGKNGKNGGNSGSLFATIKDTSEFSLYFTRSAGLGGAPGLSDPPAGAASRGQDGSVDKVCLNGPRLLNQCQ